MHAHSWLVGTNIILIILGGVLSKFMVTFKDDEPLKLKALYPECIGLVCCLEVYQSRRY